MKAKHARQLRKGILFAQQVPYFAPYQRRVTYQQFKGNATKLEWYAYNTYRVRHGWR